MPPHPRAAGRPLYAAGLLLLASGVAHLGVWAATGGPWEGPLAWRKPILFGVSAGLTALSLGWVLDRLGRAWPGDRALATACGLALVAEVGLITTQTWRGVPSHFNTATPFDAAVAAAMGWLILAVTLGVAVVAARALGPLALPADYALAARAGMLFLLFSCGVGFVIQWVGERQLAAGGSPEVFGRAGVLKFPHGMAMHALQWLPVVAWCGRAAGWTVAWCRAAVAAAAVGQALVTAYSVWQTLAGRPRGDATPGAAVLVAAGLLLLLAPAAVAAGRALTSSRR